MQLQYLRTLPPAEALQTRHRNDLGRFQELCGGHVYEKANVLQHEDQDHSKKHIKHHEAIEDLPKGKKFQDRPVSIEAHQETQRGPERAGGAT